MGKISRPKIYVTKRGRRYFIVNGEKIFISADMTKKEISAIYKLLLKSIPKPRKKVSDGNANKASAVVHIHSSDVQEPRRKRRRQTTTSKTEKPFVSTIDPLNRVTISGNAPKDSGDKDLINSLVNELNKLKDDLKSRTKVAPHTPAAPAGPAAPARPARRHHSQHTLFPPQRRGVLYPPVDPKHGREKIHPSGYVSTDSGIFDSPSAKRHSKYTQTVFPGADPSIIIYRGDSDLEHLDPNLGLSSKAQEAYRDLNLSKFIHTPSDIPKYEFREHEHKSQSDHPQSPVFSDISALDEVHDIDYRPGERSSPKPTAQKQQQLAQEQPQSQERRMQPVVHAPPPTRKQRRARQQLNFDISTVPMDTLRRVRDKLILDDPSLQNQLIEIPLALPQNLPEVYYRAKFKRQIKQHQIANARVNQACAYVQSVRHDPDYERHEIDRLDRGEQSGYDSDREMPGEQSGIRPDPGDERHEIDLAERGVQSGDGYHKISRDGTLYNDQIDKIMSRFKDYKGTIMSDQIKTLLPHIIPQSRLAFIINTDDHTKPGQHWCAVYIDARNGPESSNSLEWFDSFARPMPPEILEDCKLILRCLKPETILKVKENAVVHQSDKTSNCGWFAMQFLIDRFRGKSFAEASGYDDKIKINHSKQDEAEIEKMKQYPPFNYI